MMSLRLYVGTYVGEPMLIKIPGTVLEHINDPAAMQTHLHNLRRKMQPEIGPLVSEALNLAKALHMQFIS